MMEYSLAGRTGVAVSVFRRSQFSGLRPRLDDIAIQNDTQTHLCIQLMNKDTHKTPFIQFKMSDDIT